MTSTMTSNNTDFLSFSQSSTAAVVPHDEIPTVIKIQMARPHYVDGSLLSDTRVGPDELDQLDIISIITDDDDFISETTTTEKDQQGVKRVVVEAFKSVSFRRNVAETKEHDALSVIAIPDNAVKHVDQLDTLSMLTDDEYGSVIANDDDTKDQKGVKRVMEAIRSIKIRRAEQSSTPVVPDAPKAVRQQLFFANVPISTTPTKMEENKGVTCTPETVHSTPEKTNEKGLAPLRRFALNLKSNSDKQAGTPETTPEKPKGDNKGLASLRRFAANVRKSKQAEPTQEPEPGLASMGEEDSVM